MVRLFLLLFAAAVTSNIALTYFLGMCPFITLSKDLKIASGMGVAVTVVMTITAVVNWMINHFVLIPLGLDFLQFLVFIVTIAAVVQVIEMYLDRYTPVLYASFGIFLPLITVNCAILGVSLFMVLRSYTLLQTLFYSVGSGLGWLLAIVSIGALRKKLVFSDPPPDFGAQGITAILAGIMALAFVGFAGIVNV